MGDEKMGEKLIAPPDFDGPAKNRQCTDVICNLLLLAAWIGMTVIGLYAVSSGDYRIVLHPMDYDGNICGTDFQDDMTEYPYLLYVNSYTGGLCVKDCPNLEGQTSDNLTDIRTLVTYAGMWQPSTGGAELPIDFVQVANYSNSSDAIACTDDLCFPDDSPIASWYSSGIDEGFGFAYYVGDTYELLWRCYLTPSAERQIRNLTEAASIREIPSVNELLVDLYSDLWTVKKEVLGFGFGVSLLVSFLYVFLMRFPFLLRSLVWSSIVLTVAVFTGIGVVSWEAASRLESEGRVADLAIRGLVIVAIVAFVIAAILALLACCLSGQINTSIRCVKQAAQAINKMPLVLMIPVLQTIGLAAFVAISLVYAVYLASLGTVNIREIPIDVDSGAEIAVRTYEFDSLVESLGWFLLFCFFWTSNFICALGDMTVAMSVAKWYFARDKGKVGSTAVLGSLSTTLFYHMGTCAFGALVIAIVQIIRAVIERIRKKIEKLESKFADMLLCCCQCCFCILESCLKFLNKNAYIQTAIFGTSFIKSGQEALALIVRNVARIGALSYLSWAILFFGKLFISATTTGLAFLALLDSRDNLYNIAGPMLTVFVISYFVSGMFMGVFDIGITTILHCFVADEEMFELERRYASKGLQQWVNEQGRKASNESS